MQHYEVRLDREKAGAPTLSWTYFATGSDNVARLHVDRVYGPNLSRYPDFWSVMSIEPIGKPSRIDGRQLFEVKLRTNRPGKINAWEIQRFFVRAVSLEDAGVETFETAADASAAPSPAPSAAKSAKS
jgi:hypothetical protein